MYKNIVFDLGNVLLNIDTDRVKTAFVQLGVTDLAEKFKSLNDADVFNRYETGKINTEEFCTAIRNQSNIPLTDDKIIGAWNQILLDYRLPTIYRVKELKQQYRLFLLSNTNAAHLEWIQKEAADKLGLNQLDDLFEKAYYSHLVGMRKPDAEIYRYMLLDAGIQAQETLFIDDLEVNIASAGAVGIQTHWLLPDEKIEDIL
jgi:putative hydrolase of the HAD superfamily